MMVPLQPLVRNTSRGLVARDSPITTPSLTAPVAGLGDLNELPVTTRSAQHEDLFFADFRPFGSPPVAFTGNNFVTNYLRSLPALNHSATRGHRRKRSCNW